MTLSVESRTRRTVILCRRCLGHIACYRAGWHTKRFRVQRDFWRSANSAFIDIAILEWCKLFADRRGKHHWSNTVADDQAFIAGLYSRLKFSEAQFREYLESVKHARDKFIAHLDEEHVLYVPFMRPARASAAYLYDYLITGSVSAQWFRHDGLTPASELYKLSYQLAIREYYAAENR